MEAAAVQREALREGARRAEAVRRERLHDARARLGAADVRGQRPPGRVHRRRGEDGDPGRGDGEGQHAARAEPGSRQDRAAVRGLREEGRAEDRRGEGHAHARRQAVDDRLRQPVRAGGRPRDREGLRQGRRCSTAKGDRFRSSRRSRRSSGLPSVLFGVGLPDENAHAPNEKLDLGNFHGGIIASAFLYDEIGKG